MISAIKALQSDYAEPSSLASVDGLDAAPSSS